jgi:hypothetical protein
MRYFLAIYDSGHQTADGNFWAWRHPALPLALLQVLYHEHLADTFDAETLTGDDRHLGAIGLGDWLCAYQVFGGGTDAHGRGGRCWIVAAFTANTLDNAHGLTAILAEHALDNLGRKLRRPNHDLTPELLDQQCPAPKPKTIPSADFNFKKTELRPDNADGDLFHAAAAAAAAAADVRGFHLFFHQHGDTGVTTAKPAVFNRQYASLPDLKATTETADVPDPAQPSPQDRRPRRTAHLVAMTALFVFMAFAWLIWQNLQFADLKRIVMARQAEDERPLAAVLFVPGIGQRQRLPANDFAAPNDIIRHVGHFSTKADGVACTEADAAGEVKFPCYTLSLAGDGYASLETSATELNAFVSEASRRTRARSIILCGFNVGAIICREYLTNPRFESAARRQVTQLISVGAPHNGAELAKLPDKIAFLKKHHDLYAWLEKQFPTVNFDSELYRQLVPPQPGNYLWDLNQRQHPDIHYACIILNPEIRTVNLVRDAWNTVTNQKDDGYSTWMTSLGKILGARLKDPSQPEPDSNILFNDGDGAVSASSQDLNQVAFFQSMPSPRKIPVRTLTDPEFPPGRISDYIELMILAGNHPRPPTATSPGR